MIIEKPTISLEKYFFILLIHTIHTFLANSKRNICSSFYKQVGFKRMVTVIFFLLL